MVKVRKKDLEIALGKNRNTVKYFDFTEIKNEFSMESGFQCLAHSLHWD